MTMPSHSHAATKPRFNADDTNLAEMTRRAWKILLINKIEPPIYYQEVSNSLVYLRCEQSGTIAIIQATSATIAYLLSDHIDFYRERSVGNSRAKNAPKEDVSAKPPPDLIAMVFGNPPDDIPRLRGITNIPYFTKSGRLIEQSGYNDESGLYLKQYVTVPPVPKDPTAKDIRTALKIIYSVIQDFPLESKADKVNLLAMMLLFVAREMIDGPTPIHLVEAATPGTGKSLVVQALMTPLLGIQPTQQTEPNDDSEWQKVIGTAMISGERIFLIDNINNALASGALSNASTTYRFSTRALGVNKSIKGEIKWVWIFTGNNVKASIEIARRIIRIRMIVPAERPWTRDRKMFHIPKLMKYVDRHSDLLCWAALTIVQKWIADGMKGGEANLGTYENYCEVMSGIFDCINVKGFLENVNESFDDIAEETSQWTDFVKAWYSLHTNAPQPAKDLYELLVLNGIDLNLHGDTENARIMSLAKTLGAQKDKVFGEFRIMKGKGSDRRKWYLEKIS